MQQQQRHQAQTKKQRFFTASEVAEFEYCPLAWWYQQFEPLAQVDTEDLFARLVELEHEHDAEAPTLPEYQMIERLLVRKGAFDEGQQQHFEHAEEVEEVEQERISITMDHTPGSMRMLALVAVAMLVLAVLLIVVALLMK
jgi:hypothetical protein